MKRVLEGVKIVSFGQVISAPSATRMLSDLGADIIKIEPSAGEVMRMIRPQKKDSRGHIQSGIFTALNCGQRAIALDLKQEEGKRIAERLILEWADVVIANFTPGTLAKFSLDYETISSQKPSIIYGEISGYGQKGPWAHRRAFDVCVQAECGITAQNGLWKGKPHKAGLSIVDYLGGRDLVIGILGALVYKDRTGKGQHVDCSMYNSGVSLLEYAIPGYDMEGVIAEPSGNRHPTASPHNLYQAKDGAINVIIIDERLWARLTELMKKPELQKDPDFCSAGARINNMDRVDELVEEFTQQYTVAELAEMFDGAKLPYGLLCNIKEVIESEQTQYWNMAPRIEQPYLGQVRVNGCPIKYSNADTDIAGPAPLRGQHNEDILCGVLGYTKDEYQNLLTESVISSEPTPDV